jgi:hypothetical protein
MRSTLVTLTVLAALPLGLITGPIEPARAAVSHVKVTLPDFPVVLDGHQVDNANRQYPLIVYKEITYVPMTWFDSRMLGLVTSWSEEQGLGIEQAPVTSSYAAYAGQQRNRFNLYAAVADGPIRVNGKSVDNSQESYPLLNFRDVIYFPLTWKFAHDEFGWNYTWDDSQGLSITSNNPHVEDVVLPSKATDGYEDVALFQKYYYFVQYDDSSKIIYRAPDSDTSQLEEVRSIDTSSDRVSPISFYVSNDRLHAKYHVGGATMGHYEDIQIEPPSVPGHQGDAEQTGHVTVSVGTMPPPYSGNLFLNRAQQPEGASQPIGDPGLIYGWHLEFQPGGGESGGVVDTGTLIGNQVYVLATPSNGENPNRIYKVNTDTNETIKVVDTSVSNYKIIGNKLYYVKDSDRQLYSSDIAGKHEAKVSVAGPVSWYDVLGDSVYYTVTESEGRNMLHQTGPSGDDRQLTKESVADVNIVKDTLIAHLSPGGDYGLDIFDKSGKLVMQVADQAARVDVYPEGLLLISPADHTVKRISGLF